MPLGHAHLIFGLAASVMRILKSHTTLIADLVLLMLPKAKRYEGDSTAWGKCQLAPEGLPLLTVISETNLKGLLQEVGEDSSVSVAQKQAVKKAAVKVRAMAQKRKAAGEQDEVSQAKRVRGRGRGGRKGIGEQEPAPEPTSSLTPIGGNMEDEEPEIDTAATVFMHMCSTFEYLTKIDDSGRQAAKIEAFWKITLYAAATDSVRLRLGKKDTMVEVRGWVRLRQLFKSTIYKSAKLAARPSDCDRDYLESMEADADDPSVSIAQLQQMVNELKEPATMLLSVFKEGKPASIPLAANPLAGAVMNSSMMALLQHVVAIGGAFENEDSACTYLVKVLTEAVSEKLPESFDDVMACIGTAAEGDNMAVLADTPFQEIVELKVNNNVVMCMRVGVFAHCLKALGSQNCNVREGPATTTKAYLPVLLQQVSDSIVKATDLTNQAVWDGTDGLVFALRDIQKMNGTSFSAFWQRVYQKCLEMNLYCKVNDGIGFQQKKDKLNELLMNSSHAKIPEVTLITSFVFVLHRRREVADTKLMCGAFVSSLHGPWG